MTLNAEEILKLLSTMIGYSIRIHEVKKILMFLMGTSNPMLIKEKVTHTQIHQMHTKENSYLFIHTKPFYFNNLLEVLRVASTTPREGPRSFFSLSGIGSGLRLPTFSLPNGGFTFIIWVRLEHLGNTYIASFSTRAGDGVYLYLHNKQLCLKYRVGKDDAIKLQDCDIKPREWHMIAITHTYKVVLKSELTVNINGRLTFTQGVTYPKFEEPFFASYIGNNDAVIHKDGFGWSPVCGQVGDFMLVEGSLDAQEIRAIYRSRTLGQNGCMLVLPKRSARLAFSYTSKAVKGTFCVDTSALTDASRWASLLGDTSVSNRFPLNEALLNAGGIKLLLPLFRQIGLPAQPPPAAAATLTSSDESDENEEGETEDKEAKKSADEANGLLASNSQALCDLISFISNIVAM